VIKNLQNMPAATTTFQTCPYITRPWIRVTAGSFYCGSKIKYTAAEPAHHCQTITNHCVLCTFINKIFVCFALELLGISDIRCRNDKLIKNFSGGDGSICNSALMEIHSICWCGWLFRMISLQVLRNLYCPISFLYKIIYTLIIYFRAMYEYNFLACL